ncbi:MAG: hypothetical protein ACRDPY_14640 [Streptosporangiaceae bacterium]
MVASPAATGYRVKVPTKTRSSLMNVVRPGNARPARQATRNSPASRPVTPLR